MKPSINKKSYDPAGHLAIAVSNFDKSKKFYRSLFGKLGFKQVRNGERSVAWVTQEGFGISIKKAERTRPKYKYFAPGLQHLCVKARTRDIVDEVYKLMQTKRVYIFDEPQSYPEYSLKYYAVFFADPDGIKIEVSYY